MKQILSVYKPIGLSPLQAIHLLNQQYPEYRDTKISYAGRLDPMAEGLLLLLIGDENKNRRQYEALPKTYEFEVLFGIATDTYDTLGIITNSVSTQSAISNQQIEYILPEFVGKYSQPYPPYSSRTVNGIPLYRYAREGKINDITIPEKMIEIFTLKLHSSTSLSSEILRQEVFTRVNKVQGKFRQEEILESWQDFFDHTPPSPFPLFRFRVTCSSGTYVRTLAHHMGVSLGTNALAYTIKRTDIGPYSLSDALQLDPIA